MNKTRKTSGRRRRRFISWFAFWLLLLPPVGALQAAKVEMVKIPGRSYRITDAETGIPVRIAVDEFLIGRTEVTQEQYRAVTGDDPSIQKGRGRPVENVTWWDAIRFCNLLSLSEGLSTCYELSSGNLDWDRNGYRLPTEAEWLLAAGDISEVKDSDANIGRLEKSTVQLMSMSRKGTSTVGAYAPNAYGLHDMVGNVWEWCSDSNNPVVDAPASFNNPVGSLWSAERVLRGGSFLTINRNWNKGFRAAMRPDFRSQFTGFRVCRTARPASGRDTEDSKELFQQLNRIPESVSGKTGSLTDLLVAAGGKGIESTADWERKREELRNKWTRILGTLSTKPPAPMVEPVTTFRENAYDGSLMYLRVEPDFSEKILVMRPRQALRQPTPVVIVPYYDVDTPAGKNLGGRFFQPKSVRSFAYMAVRQGFIAVAVRWFGESYGENYNEAVARLKSRHPDATGLGKWVWDVQRLIDYLYTLPDVDRHHIGIIGHSLGSKMSLYAAAMDDRIAAVVASEGGIGLSFSNYDDYWYLGEKVAGLPPGTDHHELLGLIAPRPFMMIGGDSADKDESWHYINAVRPVYELYGRQRQIGYFNHRSGHSPTPESVSLAMRWLKLFLAE